ncbi:hypothetical protein B0I35DRAFT_478072 [Stachybotrys elegans]|uniref:Transcription factor domain-containing protein n=1 Tax=Stachybotrys elegans TaxID=80388 RepID=A0A8K0SSD2_9HYPO|nr:hypothetical protein B0I35DRAFT_478072 [Stachybotrys elegans]
MDNADRKLWDFYINSWCPGRSIIKVTNLWEQDFAKMHSVEGILSAIQSIAGIYICDYFPRDSITTRVKHRFAMAENRLAVLMGNSDILDTTPNGIDELLTLFVILSMQDIILVELRRKRPFGPRWLEGFKTCERILQAHDQGVRFWIPSNVQLSSLRSSHFVIVGRALILAQPLVPLPPPADFDAAKESSRFGWLLYGTREETYEIHGGCGFSKKLLHVMSQITFWSARLQQERESPMTPAVAVALYQELAGMKQWAPDVIDWESANQYPPPLNILKTLDHDFLVNTPRGITVVTAEAWRIAAMIYHQCRLLRLPRNHAEVLANMDDLCSCIRVMPTHGDHFTAQAPLFPVFLLGLIATTDEHLDTSMAWFNAVLKTPVRSSVPPLFEGLQRIRMWIDTEVPIGDTHNLPPAIRNRRPWWERLVLRIQEREEELFCLT